MRLVSNDGADLDKETKENIEARLEKEWTSNDEVYVCPDCEAFLYRGYPQSVIDSNIDMELDAIEKSKAAKRGGGGRSRKRKKKSKFKGYRYYDIA